MARLTAALSPTLSPSLIISPERLLSMFLWGIVCGAALALFWDAVRLTRVLIGVQYETAAVTALSQKPLPLLHRTLPPPRRDRGRALRHIVIFLQDVLFGTLCGTVLTLLLYAKNDGIFRVMAPVGMLLGFLAWHLTVGRLFLRLSQGIAYALRAAVLYLLYALRLPPLALWWLWRHTAGALLHRVIARLRARRAARFVQMTLRDLSRRAACGWLATDSPQCVQKGGWHHADRKTSKTHQKNDDRIPERADLSDADHRLCHHLLCYQNDGKQ